MDENDPPWNWNVQVKNTDPDNQDFKKTKETNPLKFWDELTIYSWKFEI